MRRNQYSISIAVGLLMGAVIALIVGNSTTAILAGVIAAGITGWIGSLQWEKSRKFAIEVANKMSVSAVIDMGTSFLLFLEEVMVSLATNVDERKRVCAIIVITIFFVTNILSLNYLLDTSKNTTFVVGLLFLLFAGLSIAVAAFSFAVIISLLFDVLIIAKNKGVFFIWYCQLIEDDRGALAATARMLCIRTGNALRIIAYPFVLIPWGFVALANNKTGIAALSAMALSGIHLSTAYFVGGIDAGNINFWLSLAIAMMAGVAIGKKIGEVREESLKIPPLPAIRFRRQVELVVG